MERFELMNEIIKDQEKLLADTQADLEIAIQMGKGHLVDIRRYLVEKLQKDLDGLKQLRTKALIEAGINPEEESFKRR